jgi:hypothetical protein
LCSTPAEISIFILCGHMKTHQILKLMDHGCSKHRERELTLFGTEAELIQDILYNLQREGDFRIFVCEHGHTHRIGFKVSLTAHAAP